jgi:hypothetical protein
VSRYRVNTTKIEYRASGVLTTAYYGEVIQMDEAAAQRLVEAGSLVPVPPGVQT